MKYKYADFKIQCPDSLMQAARDLLADAVGSVGFEAFEETPSGIRGYVQAELYEKTELDAAIEDIGLPQTNISYTVDDAEDKDWNEEWEKKGFAPILIDEKIGIYDAQTSSSQIATPLAILIDARLAFGTGTHQTTQMMLSTLSYLNIDGKRILDCGCGTGILGITAAKLGATEVKAYDIDEWSVDNTRHNARLNSVSNIEVWQGDAMSLSPFKGHFDVVMANINRNILLHDMPAFRQAMTHHGSLIISGFYEQDIPLLLEKADELGLHETKRFQRNEWACLLLQ